MVENLPTHQDIANMINTSRETVTRALLTLVQQGIVQKDAHRLLHQDPEALKKLVQGGNFFARRYCSGIRALGCGTV